MRVNVLDVGSWSSALAALTKLGPKPPAINTLPFVSKMAVCLDRGVVMWPVEVNVPGDCAIDLEVEHARDSTSALVILKFVISSRMVICQSVPVRHPVSEILRSDLRAPGRNHGVVGGCIQDGRDHRLRIRESLRKTESHEGSNYSHHIFRFVPSALGRGFIALATQRHFTSARW